MATKRILVGEGSAEPTVGFDFARQMFSPDSVEFFFGVRRSSEGLNQLNTPGVSVVANFPGRGMKGLTTPPQNCNLSAFRISRVLDSGRLQADALLVVATPPNAKGERSLGTANGPLQSAIDNAPLIIVEEWEELPSLPGAATIPADKPLKVIQHKPATFAPLSRPPTELDYACAEHIATLIDDNTPIQIGVGGIIEALSDQLKTRRNLRIISGAVGETIRKLHNFGCLSPSENILGTALVGDADIIEWAKTTANLRLMSSREIHNPKWLAKIANFHSLNIALSVDLEGNVNAESIGERQISGKGGSPNFAQGAALSPGGHAIVALRGDRENSLVDKIDRPTIPGSHISYIVCENGIADLRNKSLEEKAVALKKLFKQSP